MTSFWQVAFSAAGGVVAALTGVGFGAALGARNQRSHWARGAQLDAVTQALAQYAYIYDKFYEWCRDGTKPEINWVGWNNALAILSVTADSRIFDAAEAVDGLFWTVSDDLNKRSGDWATHRQRLEAAHTRLVTLCRRHLIGSSQAVGSVISERGRSEYEARKAAELRKPSV
jgi:hypothetical protein